MRRVRSWPYAYKSELALFTSGRYRDHEKPEPDGLYAVGTTETILVDATRGESYTDEPDDVRRLMLRIWYPAKNESNAKIAMYWEDAFTPSCSVAGSAQLPWFIFSHLGNVKTFSRWEAPVADDFFPVVVYSYGLGVGWSSANTPLVERLASHGYVVVGVDHAYIGSAALVCWARALC